MRKTIAAAWALGLATLAFTQAPQTIVATYDARALVRNVPIRDPLHRLLPLQAALSEDSGNTMTPGEQDWCALPEDHLLEILRTAVKDPSAEISFSGGHVIVSGPPAAHQAVAANLASLAKSLLQEATLEVYSIGAEPGPVGVLASADTDKILAGKNGPVPLARIALVLGQPGHVRAGKDTTFVADYSVEVANSAAIADPVIRAIQEGLDFHATVGQAADGRLLVRFGCTRAILAEPLVARSVGSTKVGDIQLPKVRSTMVVGSGLVDDGGSVLVRHDGGLGAGLLVRVRRNGAAVGPTPGVDQQVIFADDLLSNRVRVPVPRMPLPTKSAAEAERDEPFGPPPAFGADEGPITKDVLEQLIRSGAGQESGTFFEVVGSRVLARAPEERMARIREVVTGLSKGLSRNVSVDFRIGKVDLGGQPLPKNLDEVVGKVETQASVTASASDQFLIAAGLEQAALVEHDVEIAEKSQIADPIVKPLFDGYVISGVASAPMDDRIELALDLRLQQVLPMPAAGFSLRAESIGAVDLPQVTTTGGTYRLLVEPGKWTVVTASGPSEGAAVVILARARWQ